MPLRQKIPAKKVRRLNVDDGLSDWVEGEDGKYTWLLKGTRVEEKVGDLNDVKLIPTTTKKAEQYLDFDEARKKAAEAATALKARGRCHLRARGKKYIAFEKD